MLLEPVLAIPPEVTNQMEDAQVLALTDGFSMMVRVVVSLASTAALSWGLLSLMGHGSRINKVLGAILGSDIILTALTAPVVIVGVSLHPVLAQLSILGMFFWTVAVLGFIFHRALEISMGFGIMAGLFVIIFTIAITQVAIAP